MTLTADRIVVGVDFEAPSLAAARWTARQLAPDAELLLVHALPPADAAAGAAAGGAAVGPAAAADAERRLRELAAAIGAPGAAVAVREGDPAACLAAAAVETAAELIVVGAHRDHPTPWDRLGTMAERLVRQSPVPVLVAAGALSGPPGVLLVPVAADDISEVAYDWACRLERGFASKMAVVHVEGRSEAPRPELWLADEEPPPAPPADLGLPRWRRLLADRRPDRVFTDAVGGDAATGILAEAERFHSGFIVVDDRALASARRTPADRLLRETARPLLVVPNAAAPDAAAPGG
jgi:nucleotide-binding universal stress UspA family protein